MGSTVGLSAVPHQTMEESLKSAYNDLRSFKYHGGEGEKKFDRDHQGDREIEEEDEEIEFLPNENGQLETVGNGFQDLNNKLLERALINYLQNIPQQEEPVTSLFRERERSSSRKRGSGSERLNVDNKELAKFFLEELQDGSYNVGDVENEGYMDGRQMLYDRYRGDRTNKPHENSGPMSWGELLNKESVVRGQDRETNENDFTNREQDSNLLYLSLGEQRNVNGGYPMGRSMKIYRNMAKRYPMAKRSPKPIPAKKQVTDPKVAQDLGALFGTQSVDNKENHTHNHDHEHEHRDAREHNHDLDHEHDHRDQHKHESSSESPKNMAENLKANDRGYEKEAIERKDKLDQQDIKQKIIKDLIIEEALRNADSEDSIDLQKV
ncbi:hypothetical protein WH47_04039 [Habropoda laboriosa]|uniref:Uncharacterized protein n=1 Tax=Habropoda laboriosa TaxID=597456 RepID=A0A0L7QUY4_9HYME|nr:hypothetical protein WH47_04039 [Habropoda laboriosa]